MWTPERIKALRKRRDETQEEFAAHFRLSVDAVRNWEQLRRRQPPSGPVTVILDQLQAAILEPDPV